MSHVFLSHSRADKPFARKLTKDLRHKGHLVWIDEAEIQIGESLIEKIFEGLDRVDYVVAILSTHSVKSEWVKRELDIAFNREITEKRIVVLPLLLEDIEIPGFMRGKLYADFRSSGKYTESLALLLQSIGPVIPPLPFPREEIERLKAELEAAKLVVQGHVRELDRHKRRIVAERTSELNKAVAEANKKFPQHKLINEAYAFEIGSSAITLDRALWAVGKAHRVGTHPLEGLLTILDKWENLDLMFEAYGDYLDYQNENDSTT